MGRAPLAVATIDADIRRMTRASAVCSRLMTIPGIGQLTALAFVAAIDDLKMSADSVGTKFVRLIRGCRFGISTLLFVEHTTVMI